MPPPTAATISVRETLDLLDGSFLALAQGVGQGRYALWLGSGISRDRVPDLKGVIKRVLSYLRDRINPADPNCRFLIALKEILKLAELSSAEEAGVALDRNVDDWASLPVILQRLTGRYALLLDIQVAGEAPDFLLWNVVDVSSTFAAMVPDCEHLCIAILAIEGVIPDVASANWDGLVEAAVVELDGAGSNMLRVCVRSEDLREPRLRARLMKFHGCAIRAATDPSTYRPLLVGRQSQITAWPHDGVWGPVRNELVSLAVTKPTLMIGLSALDNNIQDIFSQAQATMRWPWPSDPPAYVFAEDELGNFQRNILRFVYRDAYDNHAAAIEQGARLQAFGKPLLTALVLHVLCAKLQAFASVVEAPGIDAAGHTLINNGIKRLRDRVADTGSTMPLLEFVEVVIRGSGRVLSLFQEGRTPVAGAKTYRALGSQPAHQISNDPNLPTSGIREMAAALGVLGLGEVGGHWTVGNGDTGAGNDGVLRVTPGSGDATRVFFTANSGAALRLETNGIMANNDEDALVIHSTPPVPSKTRSPSRAPGRTGARQARHLDMNMLLRDAAGIDDLQDRFRIEAAL